MVIELNFRTCPRCGQRFAERPTLSRDNQTYICPDCGIRESLAMLGVDPDEQERILNIVHRAVREHRTGE